ncbi:MAG: endonuclease/exonuclease/phosphatase family protein [Bacteroidota bacterium]
MISVKDFPLLQFTPIATFLLVPIHILILIGFLTKKPNRKWALICLILLGMSAPVLYKFLNLAPEKEPDVEGAVSIMTFNIQGFAIKKERLDHIVELINEHQPDVVCFQEFRKSIRGANDAIAYTAEQTGYPHFMFQGRDIHKHGLAFMSKYPVVDTDTLFVYNHYINQGVVSTLETPNGRVGVGNIHLSSFQFDEITSREDLEPKEKLPLYLKRIKNIIPRQEAEVERIVPMLANYDLPLILATDMNAMPHTKMYNHMSKHFKDTFKEKGRGLGWTFPLFGFLKVRLDYEFVSDNVEVLTHSVIENDHSDHAAIMGHYKFPGSSQQASTNP